MAVDISRFSFDPAAFALDDGTGFAAMLPPAIAGKSVLLETYRRELRFPAFFGQNWDALEDCLNDLSWIPQRRVAIIHADLPDMPPKDLLTYLEILAHCAGAWQPNEKHELIILFPANLRTHIMDLAEHAKLRA